MVVTQGTGTTWRYVADPVPNTPAQMEKWLTHRPFWQRAAGLALIGALYFAAGKAGLMLAHENVSVSLVWPATGLAIAALLLCGQRVWPAIAAGAFLVNLTTSGLIVPSLAIAAGNTLEAVAGAWLAKRFANGWQAFERAQDIFRFALLSGAMATFISAAIGVCNLCLFGLARWTNFFPLLSNWWLGDAVGAIVVTPVIVLLATQPKQRWQRSSWIEVVLLYVSILAVSAVVFEGLIIDLERYPLTFLYIPFLFWTAFRFSPREASLTTLLIAALAIHGTVLGQGRFSGLAPETGLILAQAFLGIVGLTTLAVAASVAQNRKLEGLASQLAALVESSYDAIIGETIRGTIISWNQGAERLYGYSAAEAIGKPITMLSPSPESDEIQGLLKKVARSEAVSPIETKRLRKDGSLVDISLAISPVLDAHGRVIAASAISRDISGQKCTEAALLDANNQLKTWLNQLEQETHEIALVNQMSHLLQSSTSETEIGSVVRQFAQRIFPGDSGAVCVRGISGDMVETICAWGNHPPAEQIFGRQDCWAMRHGQLHAVNDGTAELICPHWTRGPRPAHALCVPMLAQGETLGVLLLRQPALLAVPAHNPLVLSTVSREQLAVTVASHIALALSNLRLRESLRRQSIRDSLTGLYNRRFLNEALEREVRRAARGNRQLAVLMFDIDDFKGINDTHGHEAGDDFLRELGTFLHKRVREEDFACRYGGDEFVILLTETSFETARRRARQLVEGVRALSIPHRGRYLAAPSVSLGAALYPEHGVDADALLRAADEALYKAKSSGRNRIVISGIAESRERVS
jgi:diguanylate cyclase (GGDEF)-like protein/PAS domain S-box-containing protein